MELFVTVGTTRFTPLVRAVCSQAFQQAARALGVARITLQYGQSELDPGFRQVEGVAWTLFAYTDEIFVHLQRADLVIGHCGSGTVLDLLRGPIHAPARTAPRCRLLLVPNTELMDNHQAELAAVLPQLGPSVRVSSPAALADDLRLLVAADLRQSAAALPPPAAAELSRVVRQLLDSA